VFGWREKIEESTSHHFLAVAGIHGCVGGIGVEDGRVGQESAHRGFQVPGQERVVIDPIFSHVFVR